MVDYHDYHQEGGGEDFTDAQVGGGGGHTDLQVGGGGGHIH